MPLVCSQLYICSPPAITSTELAFSYPIVIRVLVYFVFSELNRSYCTSFSRDLCCETIFSIVAHSCSMSTYESNRDSAAHAGEDAKNVGYQKAGEAHQATKDAAGAAQNKAHEVSGAAGEKAHQAGNMAGEKWDQTTQGASNVAGAAQDTTNDASNVLGDKWEQTKNVAVNKAAAVKEGAGSLLSQTGDAVTNAYEKVKATVTPKN